MAAPAKWWRKMNPQDSYLASMTNMKIQELHKIQLKRQHVWQIQRWRCREEHAINAADNSKAVL